MWCVLWIGIGGYRGVYNPPLCLYTESTPSFIYCVVRVVIEEEVKNMNPQNRTDMAKAMLKKMQAMRDMNLAKVNGGD